MRARSRPAWLVVPALLLLANTPTRAADEVGVKVVDYAALGRAIKELKGKLVVVDFWADT